MKHFTYHLCKDFYIVEGSRLTKSKDGVDYLKTTIQTWCSHCGELVREVDMGKRKAPPTIEK